jgi:hypothetical protein
MVITFLSTSYSIIYSILTTLPHVTDCYSVILGNFWHLSDGSFPSIPFFPTGFWDGLGFDAPVLKSARRRRSRGGVSGLPWSPGLSQLCSHVVDPGGAPVSESLVIEPPCAFLAPAPVVPDPIPDISNCQVPKNGVPVECIHISASS